MLDEFEISYSLSSAVYTLCQGRQRPGYRRALVMGFADTLIPEVEVEIQNVAGALRAKGVQSELLSGEEARQETFWSAAAGCDVLHLACHGMFRADNPMFSALKFADGWLTAADLLQLRLESSLVALSACESGRGYVLFGDEVIGLPRAFLGAGASSLLVSLWVVPDRTTADFMSYWYELLLSGLGRASALRTAQQALREHPHLLLGPFILIDKN
jgi:CHAT domain-containing protein